MKKVLITGGAGYIGSMLCSKLVNKNYNVTVIDNLKFSKNSLFHLFSKKNFHFINADVRNLKLLSKLINKHEYIIPLAALVGAPLCKKFPKMAKDINLENIKFIVSNLKKKHKILFPNTNSGYGVGKKKTFCDENSPLKPISLYGNTKVQAEKIILMHQNSIVFRLATVFGYSYRMRTDLLVNFFVHEAVLKKKLEVFEPNFRRNFIHINDVVNAFVFALDNFNKMKGNVYNLGLSNANLTKLQLAKNVKKIVKCVNLKIVKNTKDEDKRDYFVSNKKIEKIGFKPKTSLAEGIREMYKIFLVNNFENNKNNY